MKVTKDENGKYVVDFEGLEIKMGVGCAGDGIFNPETVVTVTNGIFKWEEHLISK